MFIVYMLVEISMEFCGVVGLDSSKNILEQVEINRLILFSLS